MSDEQKVQAPKKGLPKEQGAASRQLPPWAPRQYYNMVPDNQLDYMGQSMFGLSREQGAPTRTDIDVLGSLIDITKKSNMGDFNERLQTTFRQTAKWVNKGLKAVQEDPYLAREYGTDLESAAFVGSLMKQNRARDRLSKRLAAYDSDSEDETGLDEIDDEI